MARKTNTKEPAKQRRTLMSTIEKIVIQSNGSKLSEKFFLDIDGDLHYICHKMNLTKMQAVFFSLFIDHSHENNIGLNELRSWLEVPMISILRYQKDIDQLVRRQLIRYLKNDNGNVSYYVHHEVLSAIGDNKNFEPAKAQKLSINDFFNQIDELFDKKALYNNMDYDTLLFEFRELFKRNKHLIFVQKMLTMNDILSEDEWVLFLYFFNRCANYNDNSIGQNDGDHIFRNRATSHLQFNLLNLGTHTLIDIHFVEKCCVDGLEDIDAYCLTNDAKKQFLSELGIQQETNTTSKNYLLQAKDIQTKSLFYNVQVRQQIEQLSSLLEAKKFNQIQQRLADAGMRRGFACLFYGDPGTGKTETVLQLSKKTGRDIMKVDISQMRSKWVGESEKQIKELFDRYRGAVSQNDLAPILLFNEADALINKRTTNIDHAVDKMENTMQNIILEEMEKLDGILIATTNLTENIDKAFERRFLYKIKFTLPNVEAQKSIWKVMIPDLSDEVIEKITAHYHFSGGQIENIARKYLVDSILYDSNSRNFSRLYSYCDTELLDNVNKRNTIGFVQTNPEIRRNVG